MIIAVDFDGCLASAGTWPEVGEPNEALINWLICLRKRGDKCPPEGDAGTGMTILWTCRADEALQKAVEFCKVHGLEFDAVNDNLEELKQLYGNNSRKISADLYIDDKALKVEFPERTNDE